MTTTQQWLSRVETDSAYFKEWLLKQFYGEVSAWEKVFKFGLTLQDNFDLYSDIMSISYDEFKHAEYIHAILKKEGVGEGEIFFYKPSERYWKEIGLEELSRDDMLAAGAHAEEMRLHRIEAVMNSSVLPEHITKTFAKIYTDELRHAQTFRKWTSDEAYAKMATNHQAGLQALGLEL